MEMITYSLGELGITPFVVLLVSFWVIVGLGFWKLHRDDMYYDKIAKAEKEKIQDHIDDSISKLEDNIGTRIDSSDKLNSVQHENLRKIVDQNDTRLQVTIRELKSLISDNDRKRSSDVRAIHNKLDDKQ